MTVETLAFNVNGIPAAQGSKRHVGHGVMVESSKKVKPWRADVKAAAEAAITARESAGNGFIRLSGPVRLYVEFRLARPQSHYRTGRFAHVLKPGAPVFVDKTPDLDKTLRSTLDALTAAGVWGDDRQVAVIHAMELYCDRHQTPGATIRVRAIGNGRPIETVTIAGGVL